MEPHNPPIRSLILLGGHSTRMGSPKYLLPIPSNISEIGVDTPLLIHSLYLHHIFQVKHGDPLLRTVTLSVRDEAQRDEIREMMEQFEDELPFDLTISYVQDSQSDIGPAAGLAAAWRLDGDAHWLVNGCGHPFISKLALEELRTHHHRDRKAVTCFTKLEGANEPLLAFWTGQALKQLNQLIEEKGNVEPDVVLKALEQEDCDEDAEDNVYTRGVAKVKPSDEQWMTSVNTKNEWHNAEESLKTSCSQSDP